MSAPERQLFGKVTFKNSQWFVLFMPRHICEWCEYYYALTISGLHVQNPEVSASQNREFKTWHRFQIILNERDVGGTDHGTAWKHGIASLARHVQQEQGKGSTLRDQECLLLFFQ